MSDLTGAGEARFRRWKGLDNHQMVDAIYAGTLKGMYVCGEEMSLVDSNANHVAGAFERLEFFVVQDIFFSATCRFADVVLPGSPSLEKEGTFTSTERRIQRLYQVLEPLPGSRPDWRIFQDVANRLGARLELPASVGGHGRDRVTGSFAGRRQLRAAGRI